MRHLFIILALLTYSGSAFGDGHLKIMVPLSKQHDFKGRPETVMEKNYEIEGDGSRRLVKSKVREYDSAGNLIREKTEGERGGSTSTYEYDKNGTWIGLTEADEEEVRRFKIFLDEDRRRIAKVDEATNETEITVYSERGYEVGSFTRLDDGAIAQKVTIKRNSSDKEEFVVFEEPEGTKSSEIRIEWNAELFQSLSTFTLLSRGEATFVSNFSYEEVDGSGNWLRRAEKKLLKLPNGVSKELPVEVSEREIKYHK